MTCIGEKKETAIDYFNNLRFFESDEDRIWFMTGLNEEEKVELSGTWEAFYGTVWNTHNQDVDRIEQFFLKKIQRCHSQAILEDFYKWKKENNIGRIYRDYFPPMVPYGYMIRDP